MLQTLRSYLSTALLCLVPLAPSAAAGAETIYEFVADDGTVSLTNVPMNRRYKPLVTDGSVLATTFTGTDRRQPVVDQSARAQFNEAVSQTAKTYGLDSALLHAVISVESGYDPAAHSRKGAGGLMQLMPGTAKRYGVADVFDPVQNLQGGARYLRDLLKLFDSDLNLVLAAYNAGENAVARYGNKIPPYRETSDYVPRVLAYYRKYQVGDRNRE